MGITNFLNDKLDACEGIKSDQSLGYGKRDHAHWPAAPAARCAQWGGPSACMQHGSWAWMVSTMRKGVRVWTSDLTNFSFTGNGTTRTGPLPPLPAAPSSAAGAARKAAPSQRSPNAPQESATPVRPDRRTAAAATAGQPSMGANEASAADQRGNGAELLISGSGQLLRTGSASEAVTGPRQPSKQVIPELEPLTAAVQRLPSAIVQALLDQVQQLH